jgi:hypothetical protein
MTEQEAYDYLSMHPGATAWSVGRAKSSYYGVKYTAYVDSTLHGRASILDGDSYQDAAVRCAEKLLERAFGPCEKCGREG